MKSILESLNNSLGKRMNESVKIIADLDDYTPWSGARDTWDTIVDAGMKEELDAWLEEIYPEGLTMGELNDILWFDSDQVLGALGLNEYPKDVEVEVTNIKFAEDIDPDDVDESTTVEITINNEDDDVRDLVLYALYDDFYRLSPGDIIDFDYEINESCKNRKGKKSLKEEVSDEAYKVADLILKDIKGKNIVTWDEFERLMEKAIMDVFGSYENPYGSGQDDDFETDVRGILSLNGYGTVFEGENEGGLELVESKTRDDIDAKADNKKERAKKILKRKEDDADSIRDEREKYAKNAFRKAQNDADADRDYHIKKSGLKESENVSDQVIIDMREDGFLEKRRDLEAKGYRRLWAGNGKICMAKMPTKVTEANKGKNYQPYWSDEGTVYRQTYKITRDEYNKVLDELERIKDSDFDDDHIYGRYESLKSRLQEKDGVIYPGLTASRFIRDVLGLENFKTDRNVRFVIEESITESDKPAATSIEDAQKWVDYDMKKYGRISGRTNRLVKKAGFQIVKDEYGDYEVIAGKYDR